MRLNKILSLIIIFAFFISAVPLNFASASDETVLRESFDISDYYISSELEGYMRNSFSVDEDDYETYKRYAGIHPRLFTDSAKVNYIKANSSSSSGKYYKMYSRLVTRGNAILTQKLPGWPENGKGTTNLHRTVGDYLAALATTYLFTGDSKYYYGTTEGNYGILPTIQEACVTYPSWGVEQYNNDLVFSHITIGLCLAYDYCQDIMDEETKNLIYNTIMERGQYMLQKEQGSMRTAWGHNHSMINYTAMATIGLTFFDKMDEATADRWMKNSLTYMNIAFRLLSPDGGYHEGVQYSNYAMEFIMQYALHAEKFFNTDLLAANQSYFLNYKNWIVYQRTVHPNKTDKNIIIPFNNSAYSDSGAMASYLFIIADKLNDSSSQSVADWVMKDSIYVDNWYEIFCYNGDLPAAEDFRNYYPLTGFLDNCEIFSTRLSWDYTSPILAAKCGPPMGHLLTQQNVAKIGSGHSDPDANHFSLLGYNGEWLFSDDLSYGYLNTLTSQHSTLMIDGTIGQIGNTTTQFMDIYDYYRLLKSAPHFERVCDYGSFTYTVGDATESYPPSAEVTKFKRHMLYIKPGVILIADDVSLANEHTMRLRYIPDSDYITQSGNDFSFSGKSNNMKVLSLEPDSGETISLNNLSITLNSGKSSVKKVIDYEKTDTEWLNTLVVSFSERNNNPVTDISSRKIGSKIIFNVSGIEYYIDLERNTAGLYNSEYDFSDGYSFAGLNDSEGYIYHFGRLLPDAEDGGVEFNGTKYSLKGGSNRLAFMLAGENNGYFGVGFRIIGDLYGTYIARPYYTFNGEDYFCTSSTYEFLTKTKEFLPVYFGDAEYTLSGNYSGVGSGINQNGTHWPFIDLTNIGRTAQSYKMAYLKFDLSDMRINEGERVVLSFKTSRVGADSQIQRVYVEGTDSESTLNRANFNDAIFDDTCYVDAYNDSANVIMSGSVDVTDYIKGKIQNGDQTATFILKGYNGASSRNVRFVLHDPAVSGRAYNDTSYCDAMLTVTD